MGIEGKEGKKTTKMYVILNSGDVKLLTFSYIISLVE
jgi:hypothetical protein